MHATPTLYTIGHSHHTSEFFLGQLDLRGNLATIFQEAAVKIRDTRRSLRRFLEDDHPLDIRLTQIF